MSKRSKCVEMILNANKTHHCKRVKINLKDYKSGKNTPLHWAIYWADSYMAFLVYLENPGQIFLLNQNRCTPFDLIWLIPDKVIASYAEIVRKLKMNFFRIFLNFWFLNLLDCLSSPE